MHSTVADFLSIRWILNKGLNRIGSSTWGSWGGRYIQPMMKKPSTCEQVHTGVGLRQSATRPQLTARTTRGPTQRRRASTR